MQTMKFGDWEQNRGYRYREVLGPFETCDWFCEQCGCCLRCNGDCCEAGCYALDYEWVSE